MGEASSLDRLAGIWKSKYTYHSVSRNGHFDAEHYMRVMRVGNALVIESIPEFNESYLILRITVDDDVATGSWQHSTNPNGTYKGAIYHGAIQLTVDTKKRHMKGQYVGFNRNKEVQTGPWEFTYLGPNSSVIHDKAKGQ
jgi:hypothetical protein